MNDFSGDCGLFKENGKIVAEEPVGVARGGVAGVLAKLSDSGLPFRGKKLGVFMGLFPAWIAIGCERDFSFRLPVRVAIGLRLFRLLIFIFM